MPTHRALWQLWVLLVRAKWRKMFRSWHSPRRIGLSILGLLLGLTWISTALLDVMLRESFDPERVYRMIVSGLAGYSLWHLVRRVWDRPEQGIDWSEAELERVCGGPFSRTQQLVYRMFSIVSAGTLKTLCFTLIMWPDLRRPLWGLLGVLGGLMLVDLWRMLVELFCWSTRPDIYRWCRIGVTGSVAVLVTAALAQTLQYGEVWHPEWGLTPWAVVKVTAAQLMQWGTTGWGAWCTLAFRPFGELVLAARPTGSLILYLAWGATELFALGAVVAAADGVLSRAVTRREQLDYLRRLDRQTPDAECTRGTTSSSQAGPAGAEVQAVAQNRSATRGRAIDAQNQSTRTTAGWGPIFPLSKLPCHQSFFPLAWRQWRGLVQRAASIAAGLAIATGLILLPLVSGTEHQLGFAYVVGSLVFYSLVLLPANMKLDFRRDIDRMYLLKLLPLRPWQVVAQQLAVPVLVLTVYQALVLGVTCLIGTSPPGLAWVTWLSLIPLNIAIMGFENLIYLWYPYRLNQEGIEIFIRTTLAFTGKSILYAVGIALMVIWALLVAAWIPELNDSAGRLGAPRWVWFAGGMAVAMTIVAASLGGLLVRAFHRFDPSTDVPAP